MIGSDDAGRRWSIGELAHATGLTVRTLRHYDQIGLLRASERTASGHRRYTREEVRRLYRVRALRGLGLSLEEIAKLLADSADDLATMRDLLAAQLRDVEEHAHRIRQLTQRLHGLLDQIERSPMPGQDQFMTTLEMMSVFEAHFTQDQRGRLAERRAVLSPEAVDKAKAEWSGLVGELLRHVQGDTPVEDPRVQDLVERWDALGDVFHGGDERVKAAAKTMWQENSTDLSQRLPWSADQMTSLVAYIERVRQAR
ncbi:MerR family transcriptional regulator [Planotetraspora sp. A-T 1434]|uniref:MerR family transcriptional regulator n=1 Tax=Planotetraspora sp. A-T 1434 TaxID=2979219 RepID=UPI0021C1DDF8|nr:MerR family transcriptional regulator [Planotetraspora sp. A-T 1434]MCT9931572.1 MerR family transcriptional regulator [Planotetraspora sp. A-T 1434]